MRHPTPWILPARWTQAVALALAFLALAGAFLTARRLEGRAVDRAERLEPIFFPRPEILRPALLGFTGLAADLTWIRTVQYFGDRMERRELFPQLYQLVDMTTSLDPHFLDAYVYGGLFLTIVKQYSKRYRHLREGNRRQSHLHGRFLTTWAASISWNFTTTSRPCTIGRSRTGCRAVPSISLAS